MKEKRLTSLMIICVHKEITDKLDIIDIANKCVGINATRRQIFGVFTKTDQWQLIMHQLKH